MKTAVGVAAMALLLIGGGTTALAADKGMDQKGQMSEPNKGSSKERKHQEPNAGGPMGETEAGGAGPSGPSPMPPASAPGYEGADKDKSSRGPTSGGPR